MIDPFTIGILSIPVLTIVLRRQRIRRARDTGIGCDQCGAVTWHERGCEWEGLTESAAGDLLRAMR